MFLGKKVFKFFKGLLDVTTHIAAEFAADVVPIEIDTDVLLGGSINFEGILQAHDASEVGEIGGIIVFDAKVVNNQGKGDVTVFVEE